MAQVRCSMPVLPVAQGSVVIKAGPRFPVFLHPQQIVEPARFQGIPGGP